MCPVCREPLMVVDLEGVEIDCCPGCRGVWLDAGELESLVERAGSEPGGVTRALGRADQGPKGARRCPRCRRRMRRIGLGGEPVVELDACPHGHGLWFDSGELRAVVRAFTDGEEGIVAGFLAELFRHDLSEESPGG